MKLPSAWLARPQDDVLIEAPTADVTAGQLRRIVDDIGAVMLCRGARRVALLAGNTPAWIATDLACQQHDLVYLPLPAFFTTPQLVHSLRTAGIDTLLGDDPERLAALAAQLPDRQDNAGGRPDWMIDSAGLYGFSLRTASTPIPDSTGKITFTSGSTGTPRGVCLSSAQQWRVAAALANTLALQAPRHLCLLPLSTLLENIGGIYMPLLLSGRVVLPAAGEIGFSGGGGLDATALTRLLEQTRPASVILIPQMLESLVAALGQGWRAPAELVFAAVGGARVAPALLRRARRLGLPVFEGYGLSETASVACLNVPGRDRVGTVGRPLAHVSVRVRDDEVCVSGSTFLGYVGDPDSWYRDEVETGDLGRFDGDGYLTLRGRRKNLLISSFGRNISPEWVESELQQQPGVAQCQVFGDARPYCVALITPTGAGITDADIEHAVATANAELPDYARVAAWDYLPRPLSAVDGLLTTSGKPRREAIATRYAALIANLYPSAPPESGRSHVHVTQRNELA